MADRKEKAKKELPILTKFTDELLGLTDDILRSPIKFKDDDNLKLLVLFFVSKQYEHMKSVKALVKAELGKDACLIARSMLEGMCLLFWANNEPKRAKLWREYAAVEDYKTLLILEEEGSSIDAIERSNIINRVKIYGPKFYNKNAIECTNKGKKLPRNPYRDKWYGTTVREIFKDVQAEVLHKTIYRGSSQWIHWSVGGFDNIRKIGDDRINYSNDYIADSATALAASFEALVESVKVVELNFNLGYESKIEDLKKRYLNDLQARK
jgi:hypothetical protein